MYLHLTYTIGIWTEKKNYYITIFVSQITHNNHINNCKGMLATYRKKQEFIKYAVTQGHLHKSVKCEVTDCASIYTQRTHWKFSV
jgi:hypothetical protein